MKRVPGNMEQTSCKSVVGRKLRWKRCRGAGVIGMWWGIDRARAVKGSHDRKKRLRVDMCPNTCRDLLGPREPFYRIL
jgi:hypothetical protein